MNFSHRLIAVLLLTVTSAATAVAAPSSASAKLWASWLLEVTSVLPEIQSLDNRFNGARWQYRAGKKPRYNPELELGYEDSSAEDFRLGISQTFDFSGKRAAYSASSTAYFELEKLSIKQRKEQILADILQALIVFEQAKFQLAQAKEQEQTFENMRALIEQRQRIGDLSALDAELTLLSLAENLQSIAELEVSYNQAIAKLNAALDFNRPVFPVPAASNFQGPIQSIDYWLQQSPQILAAEQQLAIYSADKNMSRANKKIDPTINLAAVNEADEDYIALSVSIPLNIRNNYNADYQAASEKMLQAELELRALQRQLRSRLQEKRNNFNSIKKHWGNWQSLNTASIEDSRSRLNKQWQLGDIATADYLFLIQKQGSALLAGLSLEANVKSAWVDWLLETQQVEQWLLSLSAQTAIPANYSEIK